MRRGKVLGRFRSGQITPVSPRGHWDSSKMPTYEHIRLLGDMHTQTPIMCMKIIIHRHVEKNGNGEE